MRRTLEIGSRMSEIGNQNNLIDRDFLISGFRVLSSDPGLGQSNPHCGAFAELGLDGHVSAVQLSKCSDECKPETGSFLSARVLAGDLLERLAEAFEIGAVDSHSGVGNRDFDVAPDQSG